MHDEESVILEAVSKGKMAPPSIVLRNALMIDILLGKGFHY